MPSDKQTREQLFYERQKQILETEKFTSLDELIQHRSLRPLPISKKG